MTGLCAALLLSFAVVFRMAMHGPVFADEAPWLMQNSHMLYDGGKMVNMYPSCESNFAVAVPWLMMPGRVFASLLHPDNLWGMRVESAVKYLLCIGLLAMVCRKALGMGWLLAVSGVAAVMSFGFLPSIYLLDRPETSVMAGITLVVLMGFVEAGTRWRKIALGVAYFCVLSWVFSTHPKIQAAFPALLVMAWFIGARIFASVAGRLVFMVASVVMMGSCMDLWKEHQTCPDSAEGTHYLKVHTLVPSQMFDEPAKALVVMGKNLADAGHKYFTSLRVNSSYLGIYGMRMRMPAGWLRDMINGAVVMTVVGLLMALAVSVVAAARQGAQAAWPRSLPFLLVLPPLMVVMTKLNMWSFWEIGFLLYMGVLALVLMVGQVQWHMRYPRGFQTALAVVMGVSVLSHGLLYAGWKGFYDDAGSARHVNGVYEHRGEKYFPLHFQTMFDEGREERIQAAAAMCGIALDGTSKHIVFDDWTYLSVYRSFQPFYGMYLFKTAPREGVIAFLKRKESSGVVMMCSSLTPSLRALAQEKDGVCCVKP